MKLVSVKETSPTSKKKLIAIFDDKSVMQFGSKNSKTAIDGVSEITIKNYLARHVKDNENWNKHSPGALSRWVLWSAKSISQGIKNYNKNVS